MVGSREFGMYDTNGTLIPNSVYPFKFIFVPRYHMLEEESLTDTAMKAAFEQIPINTHI